MSVGWQVCIFIVTMPQVVWQSPGSPYTSTWQVWFLNCGLLSAGWHCWSAHHHGNISPFSPLHPPASPAVGRDMWGPGPGQDFCRAAEKCPQSLQAGQTVSIIASPFSCANISVSQLPACCVSQSVSLQNFSSLLSRKSFRCGLFFPDPKTEGARPVAPLFIFNNSWAAEECPAGNTARYGRFCDSIVSLRKGPLTSLMLLIGPVVQFDPQTPNAPRPSYRNPSQPSHLQMK